jgi:hypothetical protein
MNQNSSQWNFYLVDEMPGPSLDDAADTIRQLGGDPWALESLEYVRTSHLNGFVFSEFAAKGPESLLEDLRSAHARTTGSTAQPLRRVPMGDQS